MALRRSARLAGKKAAPDPCEVHAKASALRINKRARYKMEQKMAKIKTDVPIDAHCSSEFQSLVEEMMRHNQGNPREVRRSARLSRQKSKAESDPKRVVFEARFPLMYQYSPVEPNEILLADRAIPMVRKPPTSIDAEINALFHQVCRIIISLDRWDALFERAKHELGDKMAEAYQIPSFMRITYHLIYMILVVMRNPSEGAAAKKKMGSFIPLEKPMQIAALNGLIMEVTRHTSPDDQSKAFHITQRSRNKGTAKIHAVYSHIAALHVGMVNLLEKITGDADWVPMYEAYVETAYKVRRPSLDTLNRLVVMPSGSTVSPVSPLATSPLVWYEKGLDHPKERERTFNMRRRMQMKKQQKIQLATQ